MKIEIRGTKTANKGAELMLRAIVAEIGDEVELVVEPSIGKYRERAEMGLKQKFTIGRLSDAQMETLGKFVPGKVRRHLDRNYGIVFERDIDAVLDAWGFAYSEQFEVERTEGSANRAGRWKNQGKKVVVMPQAFGPFTSDRLRSAFARLLDNTDLVSAREQISYDHVINADGRTDHVRLYPDFTCLLHGVPSAQVEGVENLALIVPSAKLLTHASKEVSAQYLPFLGRTAEALRARGLDVRILVHEKNDAKIVDKLQRELSSPVPVITSDNALELKGIVGQAKVIVSSRFHALVSGLTQSVPSLAVGWSHKYEMLLDDYGCRDLVVDPTLSDDAMEKVLDSMLEPTQRAEMVARLGETLSREQAKTREMWTEVRKTLGIK